jgi:hypothetical protein
MRAVNSVWWQGVVVLLILVDVILFVLQLVAYYGKSQRAQDLNAHFGPDGSLTNLGISIVVILLAEVRREICKLAQI